MRPKTPFLLTLVVSMIMLSAPCVNGASVPAMERFVLPNGLVVLLSEEHSLPLVVCEMVIDAGSRHDPEGKEGLAYVTARGLLLGTTRLTVAEFNERTDFLGASLSIDTGRDLAIVRLQSLKRNLEESFRLLAGALTDPVFPEGGLRMEIGKTLGTIRSVDEQPAVLAEQEFFKALFPGNPYGHPPWGTTESVSKLGREDVLAYYGSFFRPGAAILAVVGDITRKELDSKILPLLAGWSGGSSPQAAAPTTHAIGPKVVTTDRKTAQASIVIGNYGVARDNPDYYPLTVMSYILGGGFGSYLMDEVRVKRGLAYGISSGVDAEKLLGSVRITLQTKNATALQAVSLATGQMERIRTEPVSDADITRAQRYLTGSFPLRFDSQAKLAAVLARIEYYGLGLDYLSRYPAIIRGISKEDVLRVAGGYLHPDKAVIAAVADLSEARIPAPGDVEDKRERQAAGGAR